MNKRVERALMMQKRALIDWKGFGSFIGAASETATTVGIALLAAAAGIGGTIGYATAKITAKGKQDADAIAKQYEDSRLTADIALQQNKLQRELKDSANQRTPKTTRLF